MNALEEIKRNQNLVIESLSLNDSEQLVVRGASRNTSLATIDLYKVRQSTDHPDISIGQTWTKYNISLHDLLGSTGTYVILLRYSSAYYSGVFTYVDSQDADMDDEIVLHGGGTLARTGLEESSEGRLYAKIAKQSTDTYPSLYVAGSIAESNVNTLLDVKFRKLI